MDLVDRLIAKAKKINPDGGVFIISNATGEWTARGRVFPDLEAALEHTEGLVPDGDSDSVIIINDLGPFSLPAPDKQAEIRYREWLKEHQAKKAGTKMTKGPKKDRRLI